MHFEIHNRRKHYWKLSELYVLTEKDPFIICLLVKQPIQIVYFQIVCMNGRLLNTITVYFLTAMLNVCMFFDKKQSPYLGFKMVVCTCTECTSMLS